MEPALTMSPSSAILVESICTRHNYSYQGTQVGPCVMRVRKDRFCTRLISENANLRLPLFIVLDNAVD